MTYPSRSQGKISAFLAFCLGAMLLLLTAPPAMAQVNGDADEITAFLANHVFVEEISAEMLAIFDARFHEDADAARQYLGNWDEMTRAEKADRLRAIMGPPPATEWLPGLGMVTIEKGEYHQSQFDRFYWVADQADERLILRTSSVRSGIVTSVESEITFYDGVRIAWTSRAEGPNGVEEEFRSSFVTLVGDDRGRQEDAAALAQEWILAQSGDDSLEGFPPITYIFRPDGSFEISLNDEATPGRAPDLAGLPREGFWGLTISQVVADDFDTGDESSGRLLLLVDDRESPYQLFMVEHLDGSSMSLMTELDTGVSRLHFSR